MKKHILKIVLGLNFIIIVVPLFAFPGDPDGGDDPPFEDPTPIDANIGILIFVAICLALTLIRNSGKRAKTSEKLTRGFDKDCMNGD